VDPSPTQQITFTLDKTCNDKNEITWVITFVLKEGNPLATVVSLKVEVDPENHPQAEATAAAGKLDDKKDAVQQVVAAKVLPTPE
jgi:hypothetical protein